MTSSNGRTTNDDVSLQGQDSFVAVADMALVANAVDEMALVVALR